MLVTCSARAFGVVLLLSAPLACRRPHGHGHGNGTEGPRDTSPSSSQASPPAGIATTRSAELSKGAGAAAVDPRPIAERIDTVVVPDDRPMLVVVGADTGRPIVHLHGMCSEARSDLEAWGPSVSRFGTILALQGNTPCSGGGDNATWTTDVADIDRRISAAIDAVRARGVKLDDREVILIGESMGASRAEALAARFPDKYTRLVLIGAPQTPSPKNLDHAAAVALLAGEREGQQKMLDGTTALSAHGLPARFWELPGAVHGAYGHEGDGVLGEAVGFVVTRGAR